MHLTARIKWEELSAIPPKVPHDASEQSTVDK